MATVRRYRAATDHLLWFANEAPLAKSADRITMADVGRFARHLREVKVAPNGHPNTAK